MGVKQLGLFCRIAQPWNNANKGLVFLKTNAHSCFGLLQSPTLQKLAEDVIIALQKKTRIRAILIVIAIIIRIIALDIHNGPKALQGP